MSFVVVCAVAVWVGFYGVSITISGPIIGAVFALGAGIIGWAYQAGNARLGVVDLFACEITTLCRVCAVIDLTRHYVQAFNADLGTSGPPDPATIARIRSAFAHFDASENYTPVFDQNAKDLQVLNIKAITNVTAFYTYMKAMKDGLRNLSKTDTPSAIGDAHEALTSIIYMQFLAFESARKAVRELIEFEPNEVDNTITVLMSEICAFIFLLHQFEQPGTEDFRHARLRLRYKSYGSVVARAVWRAKEGEEYWRRRETEAAPFGRHALVDVPDMFREWRKAAETAKELENRYKLLFSVEEIKRPSDLPRPGLDSAEAR